jgi:hypothetical protein
MVAWAGTMVVAQKVTTPEELDKTMKKVQPALQATQKAIKGNDFAEASKQLAVVKQAIEESREFWVQHKKDDAIKANQDTVQKIDAWLMTPGAGPRTCSKRHGQTSIPAACWRSTWP